jgi:hypothetical protein
LVMPNHAILNVVKIAQVFPIILSIFEFFCIVHASKNLQAIFI